MRGAPAIRFSAVAARKRSTRRKDGSLALAVWNLFLPEDAGSSKTITLRFKGLPAGKSARVTILDRDHGSPFPAYDKDGRAAVSFARTAAGSPQSCCSASPVSRTITGGSLTLTLQPPALALVEIK